MTYISINNHAKLTGLTREDIIEMIKTSGINYLDASILTYVSKIEGIEQEIMLDDETISLLSDNMETSDFNINIVGSLIKIENSVAPPSLFFISKNWQNHLESLTSYNPDFNALIPHRANGSMFIGEETVILRLSESFDGDYDIICLKDLEKG